MGRNEEGEEERRCVCCCAETWVFLLPCLCVDGSLTNKV